MYTAESRVGIGFALTVNAETRAFHQLFRGLGQSAISTIDPQEAHITIVDSCETEFGLQSVRDKIALERVRNSAGKYLSELALDGLVFTPRTPTPQNPNSIAFIGNKRSKAAIVIAEQKQLREIRGDLSNILFEEAGIMVKPTGEYEGHITVGNKAKSFQDKSFRRSPLKLQTLKIPQNIHVNGFDLFERISEGFVGRRSYSRPGFDRKFRNVPRHVRR